MFYFFVSVYFSLFTGQWTNFNADPNLGSLKNFLSEFMGNVTTFIVNAFGGNFDSLQNFNLFQSSIYQTPPTSIFVGIASILSIITMLMICFAVFGLIKKIFSIFFSGVR